MGVIINNKLAFAKKIGRIFPDASKILVLVTTGKDFCNPNSVMQQSSGHLALTSKLIDLKKVKINFASPYPIIQPSDLAMSLLRKQEYTRS